MAVHPDGPRVLSLCSGYGGLDIAVRAVLGGARTILYVEREAFPVAILAARMEEGALDPAPVWSDLATVPVELYRGRVDMVVGGLPCQPFSLAGSRLGADDDRYLWPHAARILAELRPALVFFENVSAQLSLGYEHIAEDLQALGYRTAEGVVRASDVGATHKRERLFVVGALADRRVLAPERQRDAGHLEGPAGTAQGTGDQRERGRGSALHRLDRGDGPTLVHDPGLGRREGWAEPVLRGGWDPAAGPGGAGGGELGDAVGTGLEVGRGIGRDSRAQLAAVERADGALVDLAFPPGPDDLAGWQAVLARWPHLAPAAFGAVRRMADGLEAGLDLCLCPRVPRLKAVGNGVVPEQAAYALARLLAELDARSNVEVPHELGFSSGDLEGAATCRGSTVA